MIIMRSNVDHKDDNDTNDGNIIHVISNIGIRIINRNNYEHDNDNEIITTLVIKMLIINCGNNVINHMINISENNKKRTIQHCE